MACSRSSRTYSHFPSGPRHELWHSYKKLFYNTLWTTNFFNFSPGKCTPMILKLILIFVCKFTSFIEKVTFQEKEYKIWIFFKKNLDLIHEENFMAIFTTLSVVIWFSTGTLGIFLTLVYVFTMRAVIYDILSMAIIPTLSTSILFCNLCYRLLWISLRSVVNITIRI